MSSDDNKNNNYQSDILLKQILDKVNSNEYKSGIERISSDVSSIRKDVEEVKSNINDINMTFVKVRGEVDNIKTSGDSREKTLNEVHKSIFDPFTGIYAKLSGNENQFKDINSRLKSLEEKIVNTKSDLIKEIEIFEGELEVKIDSTNKRFDNTEGKIKLLVDIGGGETFPDAKTTIDAHRNFNKLWWALILAVTSGFGKFIWDLIKEFN